MTHETTTVTNNWPSGKGHHKYLIMSSPHTLGLKKHSLAKFCLCCVLRLIFKILTIFQTRGEHLQFLHIVWGIILQRVIYFISSFRLLVARFKSSALPRAIKCLSNMISLLSVLVLAVITGVRWELQMSPRKTYAKLINERKAILDLIFCVIW